MSENEKMSNNSHAGKTGTPKKKILIVEDEPHALETLQDRLEFEGYEIITAQDGQTALAKAKAEKPDLIILDVMLPKMDGYKVCGLLKADTRYNKIPIIMLTAKAQEADKKLSQEMGAEAYMAKPFEAAELLGKISELLGG